MGIWGGGGEAEGGQEGVGKGEQTGANGHAGGVVCLKGGKQNERI